MSSQLEMFGAAPKACAAPRWERIAGTLGKLNTVHIHKSGWQVHHCGHPTANFPYLVFAPVQCGMYRAVVNPVTGRGFQRLTLAKQFVEETAEKVDDKTKK